MDDMEIDDIPTDANDLAVEDYEGLNSTRQNQEKNDYMEIDGICKDTSFELGIEDYGMRICKGAYTHFAGSKYMTPVSHQFELDSCVAFAMSAALGALVALEDPNASAPNLSKSEMVDCIPIYEGGIDYLSAYRYVNERGLHTEQDYPYVNEYLRPCRCLELRGRTKLSCKGFTFIKPGDDVRDHLSRQPLIAGLDMYESFIRHSSDHKSLMELEDVYSPLPDEAVLCYPNGEPQRHAVLVIGYGYNQNRELYYIIKNSVGLSWGVNGYACVRCDLLYLFGYPSNHRELRL